MTTILISAAITTAAGLYVRHAIAPVVAAYRVGQLAERFRQARQGAGQ
jgi:hypothetical protein